MVGLQMSNKQISEHEIRTYEAVRQHGGWQTAREIAAVADVADRTARHHARLLTDFGVFEETKVFGGYRYRIRTEIPAAGQQHVAELESAKRSMNH